MIKNKHFFICLLFISLYISLSITSAWPSWKIEVIDSTGDVGRYNSIAINSQGHVYISYYDNINLYLKYTNNSTGSWDLQSLDSLGFLGPDNSIAIDSKDQLHITSYDWSDSDLMHNLYTTTTNVSFPFTWTSTSVDTTGDVGRFPSIDIDLSDSPHISYFDVTNNTLKYATDSSGSWVTADVDTTGKVGQYTSIAVDLAGNVNISYLDFTNDYLLHAVNTTGSWVSDTVDDTTKAGYYSSIAVDISGNAHISYLDSTNGDLKYATNVSGTWVTTTVDSTGSVGYYTSIAVDLANNVHISYIDLTNEDLKYATNASGSWVIETVDRGDINYYTSIAATSASNVHISYYDYKNADLKYAVKSDVIDIMANNSSLPVSITSKDRLAITLSVTPGAPANTDVDWWMHADVPSGQYYYLVVEGKGGVWVPGSAVSYQGTLFKMNSRQLFNNSGLTGGKYIFQFEIDTSMNGTKDSIIYSDMAEVNITDAYTLKIVLAGTGIGTVTSADLSINCGTDCTENYVAGTDITLTATPDATSDFTSWSGGGCPGTAITPTECIITSINLDTTVTATFDLLPTPSPTPTASAPPAPTPTPTPTK